MFLLKHYFSWKSCLKSCRILIAAAAELFGSEVPSGGGRGIRKVEANLHHALNLPASESPLYFLQAVLTLYLLQILILQKAMLLCITQTFKMRFTSCDLLGFRGEWLLGRDRLYVAEAGDWSWSWSPAQLLAPGRHWVTEVRLGTSFEGREVGSNVFSIVHW